MKLNAIPACAAAVMLSRLVCGQEWKSGVEWEEPPVVIPGQHNSDAPSDAVVLFDGTNLSEWNNGDTWLIENGTAIPKETDIVSKRLFGDIQLHLEWATPDVIEGEGQGRGNSGVFLMGLYEVQVLDSWQNRTYFDGQAGGIYKQTPPMVNAMRKPGEWNTYDIFFRAPRFRTNGDLQVPGYVTVLHNGVLVQNHFELLGPTEYTSAPRYVAHAETGPIRLQFHRDAVLFRNIWVRELMPPQGRRVSAPYKVSKPIKAPPVEVEDDSESVDGSDNSVDADPDSEN